MRLLDQSDSVVPVLSSPEAAPFRFLTYGAPESACFISLATFAALWAFMCFNSSGHNGVLKAAFSSLPHQRFLIVKACDLRFLYILFAVMPSKRRMVATHRV